MSEKKPLDLLIACAQKMDEVRTRILSLSGNFTLEELSSDGWPCLDMSAGFGQDYAHLQVVIRVHQESPIIAAKFVETKNGMGCIVEIRWDPIDAYWKLARLSCSPEADIDPVKVFHLKDGQPSKGLLTLFSMIWRVQRMAPPHS